MIARGRCPRGNRFACHHGVVRRAAALVVSTCLALASCSYQRTELQAELPTSAQSSIIYAGDGTPIVTLHAEENRTDLTLDDIPVHVRDAVVAIEDERFWLHNGIDVRAILRAVGANAAEGGIAQGGSTITQQLVKQLLLDSDQTLDRKLQEAALAIQLEDRYTKQRILELYLNTIYFGNGAYGLSAAAHEYFGKDPLQLTVAEGALLAGLIQRPSRTDPYDEPVAAVARRDLVLGAMHDQGMLDDAAHAAAVGEALVLAPDVAPLDERYPAGHFVEEVKQWILDDPRFGDTPRERRELLFTGGLRIHTTVDLRLQAAAEAAVAAVLPDPAGPEAAVVAVEPQSGHVVAMVGGRDFVGAAEDAKVDLAMGRGRHTGSSVKPLVLAAALEDGIPLGEQLPAPGQMELACPNGTTWRVGNYSDSGPAAPVDLAEATVRSYNTVYAQLILRVGLERAIEVAHDMGITRPLEAVCSAVLGANDVQVLEMASAYGTLANRGVHVAPVLVTTVERSDGTIVWEAPHDQSRALEPWVADSVSGVLQQAVERGTGTRARIPGRAVAGKTGTGQDYRNAWFCGYTPQLATAVWVGFPKVQHPMRPPLTPIAVTGGSYPAQIWQRFTAEALRDEPALGFAAPPPTTATTAPPAVPTTGVPLVVPDVVGEQAGAASDVLGALGFRVSLVDGPARGAPGTVVAQSPRSGESVPGGGRVTLEVSTSGSGGPGEGLSGSTTVPALAGLDQAAALAALAGAGLGSLVAMRPDPSGATAPGQVWAQFPAPGVELPRGAAVQVAFAR